MVLNWKKDKKFALEHGIRQVGPSRSGAIYFCKNSDPSVLSFNERRDALYGYGCYEDIVFVNFPRLSMLNSDFKNCVFKKIPFLFAQKCKFISCTFEKIGVVSGEDAKFYGCTFRNSNFDDTASISIDIEQTEEEAEWAELLHSVMGDKGEKNDKREEISNE